MLNKAMKYKIPINDYCMSHLLQCVLNYDQWEILKMIKGFYYATLFFSGTYYSTSFQASNYLNEISITFTKYRELLIFYDLCIEMERKF